jgi:sugar/nucleoside kinase (ribokinase family)
MGSAALVERCGADEVHARTTGANVFLANEAEASALTGREPDEAVAELARHYEVACVTKGPRGAVAAIRETRLERVAPAYASTAQITGAGDAFAAAFLLSLVRGADLRDALAAACTAGERLAARRAGTEPVRADQGSEPRA